ncbi:hypothetical protein PoMZ_11360, partial [Pyricularia oryzae]
MQTNAGLLQEPGSKDAGRVLKKEQSLHGRKLHVQTLANGRSGGVCFWSRKKSDMFLLWQMLSGRCLLPDLSCCADDFRGGSTQQVRAQRKAQFTKDKCLIWIRKIPTRATRHRTEATFVSIPHS